jgi:hypothetical protein
MASPQLASADVYGAVIVMNFADMTIGCATTEDLKASPRRASSARSPDPGLNDQGRRCGARLCDGA